MFQDCNMMRENMTQSTVCRAGYTLSDFNTQKTIPLSVLNETVGGIVFSGKPVYGLGVGVVPPPLCCFALGLFTEKRRLFIDSCR